MDPIVFLDLDDVTGKKQMLALDGIEYMREMPMGDTSLTFCRTKTGYEFFTTKSLADIRQVVVEALNNIFMDNFQQIGGGPHA